ncbi:GFA family protein [Sphingomonas sp.]|uniref:GFA family protein n=1 Tax=Sphingomonas sp. TaxID=28214 RepID=UPI001B2B5C60|nr:GFA family protein [Sphingomonas sp.]MBO9712742.1 GFA family protein [Sphingomonas sp.]
MTYTGQCACGAVTATIEGEPIAVRQCWCRQCQKIAAGSGTTNAMFETTGIALRGELAHGSYVAASGNQLSQHFCPRCGTHVMGESSARPQYRSVRIGFLDEGHGLAPSTLIWTGEAPDWAHLDPELPHVERQPPPPVAAKP